MFIAATVLSVILALAFVGAGLMKIIAHPSMVEAAEHTGYTTQQYRLIGVAEVLGAAGLLIGIRLHRLGLTAATCLALLMLGAVLTHLRLKDGIKGAAPALVLGILSAVAAVLWASV